MKDIVTSETGLLTALHTIQDECRKHDVRSCSDCPFWISDSHDCGIQSPPDSWELNDDLIMIWRAFK